MNIVIAPAAADDLARLRSFLDSVDQRAAERSSILLEAAIQSLLDFPQRGRPSGLKGVRELIIPFGRAAYLIRYAHFPARSDVVVLRIWHSREERD
jgi:plasmid stabilization system protein ParE